MARHAVSRLLLHLTAFTLPVLVAAPILLTQPARAATRVADATATASPVATSPASTDDKAVAHRAQAWFAMLQSGNIDRTQLTREMNDGLTTDKLHQLSAQLKPLGVPSSFTLIDKTMKGSYTVYRYHLDVTSGALVFTFVVDLTAKIAGLFIANA